MANRRKCFKKHVGERLVLYQKGRYDHPSFNHRSVVLNGLWMGRRFLWNGRGTEQQYPCKDRFCNCLDLSHLLGWTKAGEGWKMAVAAVTGLIAKENVVATFGMLFGFAEVAEDGAEIWGNLAQVMTPIAAYGFLVFNLLCAPCFAAMGAIKREMNNKKWFWFAIGYQCGLAYVVSLCIYQIGTLITTGTFGIGTVVAFILVACFIYLLFRPYKESNTLKVSVKA